MIDVGSVIDNKYKILSKIGGGGMGTVYLALNEKLNKTWAIKIAQRNGIHDNNTAIQSLAADKKTLIGLDHPNLPSIVDVYEDDQSMIIVMDYIEGKPLSDSLNEYGAQPQDYVIQWATQLCDVLGYLHSKNIIYRDLKPSNIMLRPNGNITLIDFGAAREFKEKNLADTQCLGTIGYAAPEQFGGYGQTDARTDIFGLGATMHHLVTGIDPSKETSFTKIPIRQVNPSLSGGLERIIAICLRDKKEERYQSCAELLYALEHYEEADELFKKKQKKKLGTFITTTALTLTFAGVSVFGYAAAANQLSADYAVKCAAAADAQLSTEERANLYLDAIKLAPENTLAYLSMIELFLSSNEDTGRLTRDEASILTQLDAGIDKVNNNGYSTTIYPLRTLASQDKEGYEHVCYEIGMAHWYDYAVPSDRFTSAAGWFTNATPSYPIAQIYIDIGDCDKKIKQYEGQDRTEQVYDTYEALWGELVSLSNTASGLQDDADKRLVWRDIVSKASDKASYFLVRIKKEDMVALLDEIITQATQLRSSTELDVVKEKYTEIIDSARDAKSKINSVNGQGRESDT
jgi:serine/threonine-protein kinase